jgi:RAB6A-GEF complex partner protein 2
VKATSLQTSPRQVDGTSPSPSTITQISKLDLHSTVEDDASSETSSVGPSKPPQSLPNIFSTFSPRSSLDVRDPERELLSLTRRPSQSRQLPRSPLGRSSSEIGALADSLIMGYAQISGSFMIDEALIHASEFDEVKNRAVMGGKSGGGVVGVDSRRTASWTGLGSLGTFGFATLFGGATQSSLAEMRDRASSKSIPILSTPPSLLFVDIRLLPGESRSFSYNFKLPRNLPPSHRGRALRISYSLVITTQRPGKSGQNLSTAEIPFRVFSNLDG